jgi:hypothetical protein
MKIILDMPDDFLDWALDWVPCQGAKLEHNDDGSFHLLFTSNLAGSQAAEQRIAEAQSGLKKLGVEKF